MLGSLLAQKRYSKKEAFPLSDDDGRRRAPKDIKSLHAIKNHIVKQMSLKAAKDPAKGNLVEKESV